jgi:very-short-patch-repair endonuclease
VRVFPGVLRSAAHPADRLAELVAACLADERITVTATTACEIYGFRGMRQSGRHLLVPHGSRISLPGFIIHQSRHITPTDRAARRNDGIVLASPPRAVVDAAPWVGFDATVSVIEQVIADGRCTLETINDTASRLFHPSHAGSIIVRTAIAGRPKWRRASRSQLELRLLQAVERAGLPAPHVNYKITVNGRRYELDLAWPDVRFCVEVDHPYWHDLTVAANRDKLRDRKVGTAGWYTARLPEWEIEHGLDDALADIAVLLRIRRRDVA